MTTVADVFRWIGDLPVFLVIGVPFVLWWFRQYIKWFLFGKPPKY